MDPDIKKEFENQFGHLPQRIFFCPGRINLMGEHLDYNGGMVLPCAISLGTFLALSIREDSEIHLHSLNLPKSGLQVLDQPIEKLGEEWFYYPLGVIKFLLEKSTKLKGLNLMYYGNIPISSGLSSSASIEILTAFSLVQVFHLDIPLMDMVQLAKKVENDFIGVQTGIMDQFSVAMGEPNKALLLNCKTLHFRTVHIQLAPYCLVIISTNKSRNLADSKYNERVEECGMALKELQTQFPIHYLCDLDLTQFLSYKSEIKNKIAAKRAHHVISENERVHLSENALNEGNLPQFGNLMFSSHESLKNLYEVSGSELDTIIEFCRKEDQVLGARMTGAGFGGCAIALVKKDAFSPFKEGLEKFYSQKIGYLPSLYVSEIACGVHEIT